MGRLLVTKVDANEREFRIGATLRQDLNSGLRLHAMTDYLDARVRYRSESVNTDASGTVVSPLATPFVTAKPTPLIHLKAPTNTILKSHGRPPWYCPCSRALTNPE
jgi:hypothetical protein